MSTAPETVDLARPLSARSLIASTLLGTTPPTLPGRLLVALAAEFGIAEGTTRVALSRMTERGEVINSSGDYTLAGTLLNRQERQHQSLPGPTGAAPWSGQWDTVIITAERRSPSQRIQLRRSLSALNLAERREGIWMRPQNLDPHRLPHLRGEVEAATESWTATPTGDPAVLAAELWDLYQWADTARSLITELGRNTSTAPLPQGFVLSAAVLRHFVRDPALPTELWPTGWPTHELRSAYADFDTRYRARLREFFKLHRQPGSPRSASRL